MPFKAGSGKTETHRRSEESVITATIVESNDLMNLFDVICASTTCYHDLPNLAALWPGTGLGFAAARREAKLTGNSRLF